MSSMINSVTRAATGLGPLDPLSNAIGAMAIALLVVLLVQREVLSASGGPRARRASRLLDIAIAPLMLPFVVIMARRALDILL